VHEAPSSRRLSSSSSSGPRSDTSTRTPAAARRAMSSSSQSPPRGRGVMASEPGSFSGMMNMESQEPSDPPSRGATPADKPSDPRTFIPSQARRRCRIASWSRIRCSPVRARPDLTHQRALEDVVVDGVTRGSVRHESVAIYFLSPSFYLLIPRAGSKDPAYVTGSAPTRGRPQCRTARSSRMRQSQGIGSPANS